MGGGIPPLLVGVGSCDIARRGIFSDAWRSNIPQVAKPHVSQTSPGKHAVGDPGSKALVRFPVHGGVESSVASGWIRSISPLCGCMQGGTPPATGGPGAQYARQRKGERKRDTKR